MKKKLFIIALISGIIILSATIFILAATYAYSVAVYYTNSSATTLNINTNGTGNCIINQGGTTHSGSTSATTYIQFNTSTIPWTNATNNTAGYLTINGSQPDTTALNSTTNINMSVVTHTLSFNQTGTYYVRCFEPTETADNSNGNGLTNNTIIYTVPDTAPKWSLNTTNSTVAGSAVNHSVLWTDIDGTGLANYTFSFDNGTGTFVNDTPVAFTGTSNSSNVVKVINSTVGTLIRWIVYSNDTARNSNATQIFSYTTTSASSCIYGGSGNWAINCAENCTVTNNYNLNYNNITLGGTGTITISANITNWTMIYKVNGCKLYKPNSYLLIGRN